MPNKIYITAYRIGALAASNLPTLQEQSNRYKKLLLDLCNEIQNKNLNLKL